MDLGFIEEINENDITYSLNDTLSRYDDSAHEQSHIGVSILYLHYFNPHANVKFYAGGGPVFTFFTVKDEVERSHSAYADESDTERSAETIGLQSVWGTEWFFSENVSLIAEYGFVFSYSYSRRDVSTSNEHSDEYTMNYKSDLYRFSSTRVKIGLSMYF